jgi:hypothetical protein
LFSALNVTEQHPLFPDTELRTDENVTPEAFCSEIRYNNNAGHDFDSSGYSEPVDGVSQLEPTAANPGFGDYGNAIAVQDNHWVNRYFQVFSFGNEGPEAVYVSNKLRHASFVLQMLIPITATPGHLSS